ncbi:MAG: signal peptidase I, partial [Candidatus Thermoplasmatota archaeon]|nr:signal peptidase I [Candidatus Thermoplasmatota archaeon]
LGGFQVALLIIIGLFAGFGKSPYSFTPFGLLGNLFFVGSMLLGMEITRAYLIKRGVRKKRYTTLTLGLITLVFVFIQITPFQLTNFFSSPPPAMLEFIGTILITSISINLLACYLSYMGGATASMAYIGTLFAFEWFSPILPNPHWTLLALIGTIAPAIGFVILQNSIQEPGKQKKRHHKKKGSEQAWAAIVIFSVILIFFSYGYLGVQPTVIYSGSMQPSLDVGDIVLVRDTDTRFIQEGDIIQYRDGDTMIIHRVHEIVHSEAELFFITKGDANSNPDPDPVYPGQIQGKAIFNIPKLGWVSIYIRSIF